MYGAEEEEEEGLFEKLIFMDEAGVRMEARVASVSRDDLRDLVGVIVVPSANYKKKKKRSREERKVEWREGGSRKSSKREKMRIYSITF